MIPQKGEYIIYGLHEGLRVRLIPTHEGHKINTMSFKIRIHQKYRMVCLAAPSLHQPHTNTHTRISCIY